MNKETISYIRHIMGSDFVQLDFFNVLLAISIIVVSFIAFISDNVTFFCIAFVLGAILALFNMIKSIMKKSVLGTIVFAAIIPVLGAAVFIIRWFIG